LLAANDFWSGGLWLVALKNRKILWNQNVRRWDVKLRGLRPFLAMGGVLPLHRRKRCLPLFGHM
jgi:hypothetical protein